MDLTATFLVALALSMDAFFAGAAFGSRKVRVPASSALVVGGISGFMVLAAFLAGRRLAETLPAGLTSWLGGGILVGIGIWILVRQPAPANSEAVASWPDFDRSGDISTWEALWLGIALALDAVGTGVGMSLGGWQGSLLPVAVAGATTAFLLLGTIIGGRTAVDHGRSRFAAYLPGSILIVLGLSRLLAFP